MQQSDRRAFLKASAAALAAGGLVMARRAPAAPAGQQPAPAARGYKPLALGVCTSFVDNPEAAIADVHALEMPTCQVAVRALDDSLVKRLGAALANYGVVATALSTGGPGLIVYNFYDGPLTLGIVPRTYRAERIEKLKKFSDFAKQIGIPAIRTHVGFIPEDPSDPLYREAVESLRDVCSYCKANGQDFLYETGTETPVTLLRTIQDVGMENQGVNLDTANFVLYGKANPLDALDVLGPYVKNTHAKDGFYPTNAHDLGKEAPIPHGKVDFPRIIQRLKQLNYQGPVTIEREISGPGWKDDVKKERDYLAKLIES